MRAHRVKANPPLYCRLALHQNNDKPRLPLHDKANVESNLASEKITLGYAFASYAVTSWSVLANCYMTEKRIRQSSRLIYGAATSYLPQFGSGSFHSRPDQCLSVSREYMTIASLRSSHPKGPVF